jgi:hypothetical protein
MPLAQRQVDGGEKRRLAGIVGADDADDRRPRTPGDELEIDGAERVSRPWQRVPGSRRGRLATVACPPPVWAGGVIILAEITG